MAFRTDTVPEKKAGRVFLTEVNGRGAKVVVGACTREEQLAARQSEAAALAAPVVVPASPRRTGPVSQDTQHSSPRER